MVTKPVVGGSADAWGTINNAALDALEAEISGAGDISGAKTVVGDGELILSFDDAATLNQSVYGAATTTGKTVAIGDAAIKLEASQEPYINDVAHDWNVGLLMFNWTADSAALSVGNPAAGDGIFVQATDTANAQVVPPNAVNIFAGSPALVTAGKDSGTATATGATTLTDSSKSWATNKWVGRWIVTPNLSNLATARRAYITSNTGTVITHTGWKVTQGSGQVGQTATSTPSGTTAYVIPASNATGLFIGRNSAGRGLWISSKAGSGNAGTTDEPFRIDDVAMTAGTLLNVRHGTSAFTGIGIKLDLGNDGGSHTGMFLQCLKNGVVQAYINENGEIRSTFFTLDGVTGAVADSRWMGATVSGAPASGTFLKGDFVIAQDGHLWICTTAGTPGTWRDSG